jgi:hypothetical protein
MTYFELLCFDNEPKCEVVQHLFGRMVLVAFQKNMRFRDGVVGLCINDMANLVWPDNNSYSISKACSLKHTPNDPGIDFIFWRAGYFGSNQIQTHLSHCYKTLMHSVQDVYNCRNSISKRYYYISCAHKEHWPG